MSRLALAAVLVLGCTSSAEPAAPVAPFIPPPKSAMAEEGIVREVFEVEGVTSAKNPTLGIDTPKERNTVRVVRYRAASNPPKPARAVVVMMPGFLGGAGSFDPMARALVRRALNDPDGTIEAWAIDRRANLLEDTHGDDVAEVRKDPDLAHRYYDEEEAIEGKTFAGFLDSSVVAYESEWGAEVTLGDLRRVIELVPDRKTHVVLVGHSLGATLGEAYASWDFAGAKGADDLAGLVMVDGVAGRELDAESTFSEKTYLEGDPDSTGNPFASTGLNVIRKTQPYIVLPFLGVKVLEHAERMALATAYAPTAPRLDHDQVTNTVTVLLGVSRDAIPKMTNRAAFGFAFDDASSVISIAAISAGASTGGALAQYDGLLGGQLLRPSDPQASYDWVDFDAAAPKELSRLSDMARAWYEGPGLNFAEWYFPSRLALDAGVCGSLNVAETDWRTKHGIRARHGAELDLPVLAFAASLTADPVVAGTDPTASRYDKLKAMLTKPIGAGRPLAGVERSDPRAYRLIVRPQFTHIDPLAAADVGDGKIWYDELAEFVRTHTSKGGVLVPAR